MIKRNILKYSSVETALFFCLFLPKDKAVFFGKIPENIFEMLLVDDGRIGGIDDEEKEDGSKKDICM